MIRNDLTPDVVQDFDELDEPRNQARLFAVPAEKVAAGSVVCGFGQYRELGGCGRMRGLRCRVGGLASALDDGAVFAPVADPYRDDRPVAERRHRRRGATGPLQYAVGVRSNRWDIVCLVGHRAQSIHALHRSCPN